MSVSESALLEPAGVRSVDVMTILPNFLSDIPVNAEAVPATFDGITSSGVLWQAAQGRFLLDLPAVARYQVYDGQSVAIDQAAGADPLAVARFFRTTPLAALLYQRGLLAFHGVAVCSGRGAVIIAGDSGCGKSAKIN